MLPCFLLRLISFDFGTKGHQATCCAFDCKKMEGYRRPRPESAASSLAFPAAAPSLSTSRETMDVLCRLSDLLHTGLSREALVALVELVESGVSPEAVAAAVLEVRREIVAGSGGGAGGGGHA